MMEVVGAKRIFERSISSRKLRYIKYFGDGDSKAYFEVKDTYKPDMVNKYECVSHYQKRLGTRLRKIKKTTKGLKALTDAVIDKLQNYFGMALRANTGVQCRKWLMQFGPIFCMFLATKNTNPTLFATRLGWCQYRRDEANNTNLFKHGPGLPNEVVALVKPIYKNLIKH